MAMNEDELTAIYRQHARERSHARIDARILQAAAQRHDRTRWRRHVAWIAMTACLLLWLAHVAPMRHPFPRMTSSTQLSDAGRYMLHMDFTLPHSTAAASDTSTYLLNPPASDQEAHTMD